MFGYININKPELKIREFARYQSYYCGLCHVLRERHGLSGQLTLTYDMTFLVILLSSLYELPTTEEIFRCPVHPTGKRPRRFNKITEYGADMNVLLAWYKCADDLSDDRSLKALGAMRILDRQRRRIQETYPDKSRRISHYLRLLSTYEKQNSRNMDQMAGCFGKLMGLLFDYAPAPHAGYDLKDSARSDAGSEPNASPAPNENPCIWNKSLKKFGFFLGKYIYMLDAWLDLDEDQANDRYNPLCSLAASMERNELDSLCLQMLELTMGEACREFEKLPLVEDAELMRNILYAGVWKKYDEAIKAKERIKNEGSL